LAAARPDGQKLNRADYRRDTLATALGSKTFRDTHDYSAWEDPPRIQFKPKPAPTPRVGNAGAATCPSDEPATITEGAGSEFPWKFWSLSWPSATAGEHTITSRATDTAGNVQPAMTDPRIANKKTYWESNGQITRRVQIS